MTVLLRRTGIELYYAGRSHWVGNSGSALKLESIEMAAELSRDENFTQMEIVVDHDDPACTLVLPLRGPSAKRDDT